MNYDNHAFEYNRRSEQGHDDTVDDGLGGGHYEFGPGSYSYDTFHNNNYPPNAAQSSHGTVFYNDPHTMMMNQGIGSSYVQQQQQQQEASVEDNNSYAYSSVRHDQSTFVDSYSYGDYSDQVPPYDMTNSGLDDRWVDPSIYDQSQDHHSYQQYHHPPQNEWYLDPSTGVMTDPIHNSMMSTTFPSHLHHHHQQQQQQLASATPGSYVMASSFSPPQLYGHSAVTSLTHDTSYDCLYVGSTTQTVSSTRFQSNRAGLLLSYRTNRGGFRDDDDDDDDHDVTNPMLDDLVPYSCVAGHPEASPLTLNAVYESIYGISQVTTTGSSATHPNSSSSLKYGTGGVAGRAFPPPHAYCPPYGGGSTNQHQTSDPSASLYQLQQQPQHQRGGRHIGISDLVPLEGGFVSSVSPAAVRVHSVGGLQVTDRNLEGMLCLAIHPYSGGVGGAATGMGITHLSVGGVPVTSSRDSMMGRTTIDNNNNNNSVYCLDLWQGLRTVYSRSFSSSDGDRVGITTMQTNFDKGSIVCGSSDGKIRILDSSLREVAVVRSHLGGVSSMAISPDGTLIATTGFSSKAGGGGSSSSRGTTTTRGQFSSLYAYPDTAVLLFDIRYLGRGGIAHSFAGVKGAPRHVRFVPNVDGCASNRFLVASGKPGGGIQVLTPFEEQSEETTGFILPPLELGEFMTTISDDAEMDTMALGTSFGRILRYRLARGEGSSDFVKTKGLTSVATASPIPTATALSGSTPMTLSHTEKRPKKKALPIPSFELPLPGLSMDANLLQGDPRLRSGQSEEIRTIFGTYILQTDPTITPIGNSIEESVSTFGVIAGGPIVPARQRSISSILLKEATTGEYEYMVTIPVSKLGVDLMENHDTVSARYKGKKLKESIPNPNKFLYNDKLVAMTYQEWKRKQGLGHKRGTSSSGEIKSSSVLARYQLPLRSGYNASGAFDPSDYNDTGLFPGWDYGTSMPNEWASPVLLLFYFIPELRSAVLAAQFSDKALTAKTYEKSLAPELGFVFHQIDCLSRYGLLYPNKNKLLHKEQPCRPKIGAWVPSNFLTLLATMPEAEQLQVLDGSPAAIDRPRRPESFYRFLAYQLDKELSMIHKSSTKSKSTEPKTMIMDSLSGFNFLSSNQFIESKTSPPTQSVTRALTLNLTYDIFPPGSEKKDIRFGELLQHSLCRETRLRAWNSQSQEYETIVQRKIATSLPQILTLSCDCAGRKQDDGLWAWRRDDDDDPWLPEIVEVELEDNGNVTVSEWREGMNGPEVATFRGKSSLPPEVARLVSEASSRQKCRYRLEAVLSFISDNDGKDTEGNPGHHVLHARVSREYKLRVMKDQLKEARKMSMAKSRIDTSPSDGFSSEAKDFVMSASVTAEDYEARAKVIEKQISTIELQMKDKTGIQESEWSLYNGYIVTSTVVEDARAFHVPFKEPVIVVFRSVDDKGEPVPSKGGFVSTSNEEKCVAPEALNPRPLNTSPNSGGMSSNVIQRVKEGRPLAFDAEFVSVQEEEWALTESGQKHVLRETRHALGRISVFDCPASEVIIDDHVLPRERVVDFLTRFSGIVAEDLDPIRSTKRLISTRSAYLQLRYLMEQGCIFVGHGLKQDFYTVNLVVPPHQILDTVEIFHSPGMRHISLRFLTNYVLGRDIQEDIHNSVEDAKAAYELLQRAQAWKREGTWDERLRELYAYGDKISWKLGSNTGQLIGTDRPA